MEWKKVDEEIGLQNALVIFCLQDALIANYEQFAGLTRRLAKKRYAESENDLPQGVDSIATQNEKLKRIVNRKTR